MKGKLYFYQGAELSVVKSFDRLVVVFQFGDLLLSEYRHGAMGNSLMLVTDAKKTVLKADGVIKYSPYGYADLSPCEATLGFNGQARDFMTNCDLLGRGKRAFSPVLMRFHSPDSYSPFGTGGVNSYAFCNSDPVNYFDPSGGMKRRALGKHLNQRRESVIVSNPQYTSRSEQQRITVIVGPSQTSSDGEGGVASAGISAIRVNDQAESHSSQVGRVTPPAAGPSTENPGRKLETHGFSKESWAEAETTYSAYKMATPRRAGRYAECHYISAIAISDGRGSLGAPYKSYKDYAKKQVRGAGKIQKLASVMANTVMNIRKFRAARDDGS